MKNFTILFLLMFGAGLAQAEDIGEEYIQPLKYPKLSLMGEYGIWRNYQGFSKELHAPLPNEWGGGIGIDVGLYRYMNAGVLFSNNFASDIKTDRSPFYIRVALFAKPFIPIGNRFSIFSRIGGGFSVAVSNMLEHLYRTGSNEVVERLHRVYKNQDYAELAPGANAMVSLGIEAFPFTRFGLSLEWVVRAEYFYCSRGSAVKELMEESKSDPLAPNTFHYLKFDAPIFLNFHIIL